MTSDSDSTRADSLDQAKFDLEKWRVEQDTELRRGELELKQKESSKSVLASPVMVGIIGLFATVLAGILQNYLQARDTSIHENQKLRSTLLEKALETDDRFTAANRLKRLVDLNLIEDDGTIAQWIANPGTIPVDTPSDTFVGTARRNAKLSIGTGKIENFSDLKNLLESLPSADALQSCAPTITNDPASARVKEEQRNVHVQAFLFAVAREADNDFHLIIGQDPKRGAQVFMTAEVSGLPQKQNPSFSRLSEVREAFEGFFNDFLLPRDGFYFYQPPMRIEIEGSLFCDFTRTQGDQIPGRPSLLGKMPTSWEIHPVTRIKLDR